MDGQHQAESRFTLKSLIGFTLATFGITWGISGLIIFRREWVETLFGEISATNPLFILAVYSPAIAALAIIAKAYGTGGLKGFFRRLCLWRAPKGWWFFLLLGIPAVFYTGASIKGGIADPFPFSPWVKVFPALVLALLLGPVEELGWRGFALPVLQRYLAPFWAGLLIGVVWAVWHIPAFLMSGAPQSGWSYSSFFIGVIAISIILTPLFNQARGSLLIAYLYHFQMMNPLWPDAQPYDTWLFVFIALLVVWLCRDQMFDSGKAFTRVISP